MKVKPLYLIFGILLAQSLYAQYPHVEAENHLFAYWNYQRKLEKYFITSPGDFGTPGSGIPASIVNMCPTNPADPSTAPSHIKWGDATIDLGWYLAKLALEYKLLVDVGEDTSYIVQKIYEELQTINRLDCWAEISEQSTYTPACNMEGFFLRDDVFEDQSNQVVTPGQTYQQLQYESDMKQVKSGDPWADQESQDQLYYLLMGLKCVTDWIPSSVTYKYAFATDPYSTSTSSLKEEAINITNRLCYYMRSRDRWLQHDTPNRWWWQIVDNVSGQWVDPGADGYWYSTGTDGAQENIIGHNTVDLPWPHFQFPWIIWSPDEIYAVGRWWFAKKVWKFIRYFPWLGQDNEHMYEVVASMGDNVYSGFFPKFKTSVLLKWRSSYWSIQYIPLFYSVTSNAPIQATAGWYWDEFKFADILRGAFRYPGNSYPHAEWSSTQRFIHPERRYPNSIQGFYGDYNNLDYMFLFNLFYIKHWNNLPPYLHGTKAHISSQVTFPYHGYGTTSNPYLVQAFESIEAINNVTSISQVTYRAGDYIELKPGFNAIHGTNFHAYIAPLPEDDLSRLCVNYKLASENNDKPDSVNISFDSENNQYKLKPNPIIDKGQIDFDLQNNSQIQTMIYNQYGQLISSSQQKRYEKGFTSVDFNLSSQTSGVYFIKIIIDGENRITKKIIKL